MPSNLPHCSAESVCMQEEDRVVCMRFGHDWDQSCMQMDEVRRFEQPGLSAASVC